ncbi:MAG TPA: peptide-methionine (R)-S-oxide reductase MsrB [Geminicoccaceae bacterium]|nr:peptide-methionine (R)-S-oxide reductase MsrB [Geminicoccaceae bacterium]
MQRRSLLLAGTASAAGLGLAFLARGHSAAEVMPDGHVFAVAHTEDEWRRMLTPAQYDVLRDHGTEPPYSSPLDHEKRPGTFRCAGCGQDLFSSAAKFDSGTGWPSFTAPLEGAVGTSEDRSFFMVRTEVHCSRCGGHLGHVFEDGPPPTGLRYCMNGVAMTFAPADGSVS